MKCMDNIVKLLSREIQLKKFWDFNMGSFHNPLSASRQDSFDSNLTLECIGVQYHGFMAPISKWITIKTELPWGRVEPT